KCSGSAPRRWNWSGWKHRLRTRMPQPRRKSKGKEMTSQEINLYAWSTYLLDRALLRVAEQEGFEHRAKVGKRAQENSTHFIRRQATTHTVIDLAQRRKQRTRKDR